MLVYSRIDEGDDRLVTGSGRWDDGWEARDGKVLVGVLLVNWETPKEGEFAFIAQPEFRHCLDWHLFDQPDYLTFSKACDLLEAACQNTEIYA